MRAADSRPCKGNRSLIPYPSRATARAAPAALRKSCLKSGGRVLSLSLLFAGAGPRPARQHTYRERWFGKPRRRCGTAPAAIFANPGPSGPAGIQTPTQISARRKFCLTSQVRVPRNGGPGVRRIWTRSVHPEPSPGGVLVPLPPWAKELAARRRRNPPQKNTEAAR